MLHNSSLALWVNPSLILRLFVCSFSPAPLIVFLVAMKKCAIPLSEPLDDHRPRSEMAGRSWCVGGRGEIVTSFSSPALSNTANPTNYLISTRSPAYLTTISFLYAVNASSVNASFNRSSIGPMSFWSSFSISTYRASASFIRYNGSRSSIYWSLATSLTFSASLPHHTPWKMALWCRFLC